MRFDDVIVTKYSGNSKKSLIPLLAISIRLPKLQPCTMITGCHLLTFKKKKKSNPSYTTSSTFNFDQLNFTSFFVHVIKGFDSCFCKFLITSFLDESLNFAAQVATLLPAGLNCKRAASSSSLPGGHQQGTTRFAAHWLADSLIPYSAPTIFGCC